MVYIVLGSTVESLLCGLFVDICDTSPKGAIK